MSCVLIQCGDSWENQTRILALARHYREAGLRPRIIVYTSFVGALFLKEGFEVEHLDVTRLPAAKPKQKIEFNVADLRLLDERVSTSNGNPGPFYKQRQAVRERALSAAARLDSIGPAAVAVWNGYTGLTANVLRQYKSRRRLPGGFLERGLVGDSVFYDEIGVNGDASIARGTSSAYTEAQIEASTSRQADRVLLRFPELGRERFREATEAPREKIVFVPLQVQHDSNIILHSPAVKSMRRLALEAIAMAQRLGRDWSVVVRPHPEELPRMRLNLPGHPRLSVDSRNSLNAWLDRAGVVLTVNSTVGLEAAIRGAPVICMGEGIYCREPFVLRDAAAGDQLTEALGACDSAKIEDRRVSLLRFICTLFDRHQLTCDPATGRALAAGWIEMAAEAANKATVSSTGANGRAPEAAKTTSSASTRFFPEAPAKWAEALSSLGGRERHVVDVFLRPGNVLNLSYRKNREVITRGYLLGQLRRHFGTDREFELRRTSPKRPARDASVARIAIVDRDASFDSGDYSLVLDQYGEPHFSFLGRSGGTAELVERIKALYLENRELREANELLLKQQATLAHAEADLRPKA